MDTAPSDIRAVGFTPDREGDSPVLPDLLDRPRTAKTAASLSQMAATTPAAATAPSSRALVRRSSRSAKVADREKNCPAALDIVLGPMADNVSPRNETRRATRHQGRAFWKRWSGYHARGRAEAKRRCLKAFGERIAARDPDRQTAISHIRVALINRFSGLGTAEIVRAA